jgi:Caspase domain
MILGHSKVERKFSLSTLWASARRYVYSTIIKNLQFERQLIIWESSSLQRRKATSMANYPCIAIGINRYQFLVPLNCGQADAIGLRQFLVDRAGLPSNHCLLLTDSSPWIEDRSTYPSRENICRWLELDEQNLDSDKFNHNSRTWRWFFFSGWGVSWDGVDYLMPIDGNSKDIPGTGIPVRSLFTSLKAQGGNNILVLLDINRSPGLEAGQPAGAETIDLAHNMGITLILSGQLNEFSHEATGLGNGLFTTALLESLRYYQQDLTLQYLDEYLRDRTPELNEQHWRPIQTPLIIIPKEETKDRLILPTAVNLTLQEKTAAILAATGIQATTIELHNQESNNGDSTNGATVSVLKNSSLEEQLNGSLILNHSTAFNSQSSTAITRIPRAGNINKIQWWQQLLRVGGGLTVILAMIFAAFIIRNRHASNSQQALDLGVGEQKTKVENQQSQSKPLANQQETREQSNQITLAQAKGLIQPNQASLFNKAIAQARKIQPGDPLYQQAQEDISRWSQVILDLAEGRAKQGNLQGAIVAAKLVTPDNPSIYAKAQKTIAQWQVSIKQQEQNQVIIQEAKQQLVKNQASSYHGGIINLQKIPSGEPGYGEAQKLIAKWSNRIYLIANSRGSREEFAAAIQTAELVPEGTPSYELAQTAIARWKEGKP